MTSGPPLGPAASALRMRALCASEAGDDGTAGRLLAPYLARHPDRPSAALARATLAPSDEERRAAAAALRRCLTRDLPREQRAVIRRRLAQLLDELGAYAEAWHHLQEANRLAWQGFDPAREDAPCRWILRHFPVDAEPPSRFRPATVPPLVVGIPRSGTTLLERMLAAHPAVHGAGEPLTLPEPGRGLYAESLSTGRPPHALLSPARLDAWRAATWRRPCSAPRAAPLCWSTKGRRTTPGWAWPVCCSLEPGGCTSSAIPWTPACPAT